MFYDNRREIIAPVWFNNSNYHDLSNILLDTEPLNDVQHCKTLRFISKIPITLPYNKHNANKAESRYTNTVIVAVKQFIKVYYTQSCGLRNNKLKYTKDLISCINYIFPTKDLKLSVDLIIKIKNRKIVWRQYLTHILKEGEWDVS